MSEFKREVLQRGIVASVGETTLWRWLSEDAIRPWTHRSWIFPRVPDFEAKASRLLDLYEGRWKGKPLQPADCSIVQRKVLTPADFASLEHLAERILRFQEHYQQAAKPFEWRFTRRDLARLLRKLESQPIRPAA